MIQTIEKMGYVMGGHGWVIVYMTMSKDDLLPVLKQFWTDDPGNDYRIGTLDFNPSNHKEVGK